MRGLPLALAAAKQLGVSPDARLLRTNLCPAWDGAAQPLPLANGVADDPARAVVSISAGHLGGATSAPVEYGKHRECAWHDVPVSVLTEEARVGALSGGGAGAENHRASPQ